MLYNLFKKHVNNSFVLPLLLKIISLNHHKALSRLKYFVFDIILNNIRSQDNS